MNPSFVEVSGPYLILVPNANIEYNLRVYPSNPPAHPHATNTSSKKCSIWGTTSRLVSFARLLCFDCSFVSCDFSFYLSIRLFIFGEQESKSVFALITRSVWPGMWVFLYADDTNIFSSNIGNLYSIENPFEYPAKLFFVQGCDSPPSTQV